MQRKATKNTRAANADEKRYHAWIKERCICSACCRESPVIAHHCEGATFKHNKVLVGHWFVIGLCQECDDVITKGSRKVFRDKFGAQADIWVESVNDYYLDSGERPPNDVHYSICDWGR